MKRREKILIATVVVALLGAPSVLRLVSVDEAAVTVRIPGKDITLPKDADLLSGLIPARATIADLFKSHLIAQGDGVPLMAAIVAAIDVRKLRAGQPYALDRMVDGRVRRFEYEIDNDRRLVVARASFEESPRFISTIERIPKQVSVVAVEGEINRDTNSLVASLDNAGERIELALSMAEVFSGEIDFNADLQPGDRYRVLVERHTREGQLAGYGPILAAEFVNHGRTLKAIRFTPEGGVPAYYDENGRSLKRFFLKSPLKFEPRITSRFSSSRKHPVLGYARAHNGVDYYAPMGAPVNAVAPGVVTMAGWTNGGGRTVKVRHNNGYETEYLHLSAIAVRSGQRISQGDLVGNVGKTGLVTGVHLHYGMKKNGRYVNPVIEHRNMPPGEPVPAQFVSVFASERDRFFNLLYAPTPLRAADNE